MISSRFMILYCIACLLFLPSCSDPEKKKDKHLSTAMEYIQKDDKKSAIIELKNAIQIDPKFADARYQLGLLYLEGGDSRAAFGELQRAANLDRTNLDANIKVAEFYLLSQQTEESREYAMRVLDAEPHHPDAIAALANIELLQGNYEAALDVVERLQKNLAETSRFYSIKGKIFAAQNKMEEAEEAFTNALKLEPENFTNYHTLFTLYQQQKRKEDAEKLLNQAATTLNENTQVYLLTAKYHQVYQELDKAFDAVEKAIAIEPKNEQLYLIASSIRRTQKKLHDARTFLQKASSAFPESLEIKSALADILVDLREFDEAVTLKDEILASNPNHGGASFVQAKLLLKDNKIREAIDLLTTLTTNYPKWAEPFHFLGLAHLRLGEVELALKNSATSLQLSPAKSKYHALQSQILLIQGESQNAGKEASIALRLDKTNFNAAKLLAKALLQDKRFDDALKVIGKIRSKVPNDLDMIGSEGLAYLGKNDLDSAYTSFARLLELAPSNSKALSFLASIKAKSDILSGIEVVKEQIAKVPEAAGHHVLLGNMLLQNNQPEEALSSFGKAQQLQPENPQPYILRAQVMHALGKTDEAINEFQDLLAKHPDSIPANLGIATLFEVQKNIIEAKAQYKKVLSIEPNQPAAANNLAYLIALEKDGDLGEALRLAMLAKQAAPEDPRIADTLGMVHLKRESYGLAISQFEQALQTLPDEPIINYHLALAKYRNNDKSGALSSVKRALDSQSQYAERGEAEELLKKIQEM